jgi:hypothetical protein
MCEQFKTSEECFYFMLTLNSKTAGDEKRQDEIIRIQKKRNNFVMLDKGFLEDDRLSFKAKGILAYLLSKPDDWKVIVKDLINHSTEGKHSIYSGLNELKQYGYYRKVPVRSGQRIAYWESVIFECPEENTNEPTTDKNAKKGAKKSEKPMEEPTSSLLPNFQYIENLDIENQYQENREHNNIYNTNNNSYQELSINPAQAEPETENQMPAEAEPIDVMDKQQPQNPEITKETIANKIGLSELVSEYPDKEKKILELYDIICGVLTTDNAGEIRVAKRQLPAIAVKQEFSKLGKGHILYVLDCLEKNSGNIRDNAKGYIFTSLYGSDHSIGFYGSRSQSAFKGGGSSNPKVEGAYDISKFFISNLRKPLNV